MTTHHATDDFATNDAIFTSAEALHAYLQEVRRRRERRKINREERHRLQRAMALVQEEIDLTRQEDDPEILAELEAVMAQFALRLHLLCAEQPAAEFATTAPPPVSVVPLPEQAALALPPQPPADSDTPAAPAFITPNSGTAPVPPLLPRVEQIALSPEERALRAAALMAELDSIATRWRDLDNQSLRRKDGHLDRPLCLQTRALACALAGIRAEARLQEVSAELREAIGTLRDQMQMARLYANDTAACLPFNDDCDEVVSNDGHQLTPENWNELARLYETTAEAQAAWEWYDCHHEALDNGQRVALLNAIGAAQQMLFCALEEYGSRDKLQGDLYGNLRAVTAEVGYLNSLDVSMPWEDLEALSGRIAHQLGLAQRLYLMRTEARAKEARKTAAIEAVLNWNRNQVALSKFTLDHQRAELLRLLDECVAAGVPPTHLQVRGALLETGPMLLDGQRQYCKFLDAVLEERKRKGMDRLPVESADSAARKEQAEAEEDEPADSKMEAYRQYVSLLTEGQKILILGGVPRMRVCEELKQMLNCAEVKWPESKKGDRASKFQNDINRADFLILVKNFASHEMTEKGREWMRARGGDVVLLPGGYGVNQIIHQFYNYIMTREGGA